MPATTAKLDIPRLQAALKNKLRVVKKSEVQIVNKAAKDIAFRAASFTTKATTSDISQKLKSDGLLPKLAAIACNNKYGKKQWNRQQWKEMCREILKRRKRGLGALRAGWIPAIQQLGGNYRGAKLRGAGSAAEGFALPANIQNISSLIVNNVRVESITGKVDGAGDVAESVHALERAVEFVTEDIEGYVIGQMTKAANLASDK